MLLGVLPGILLSGVTAMAAQPVEVTGVQVGFAGLYKVGHWTPVVVQARAGNEALSADVQWTTPDGEGVPSRVTADQLLAAPPGQDAAVTAYVKFGQFKGDLKVRLESDRQLLVEQTLQQGSAELATPLADGQELIVMLGSPLPISEGAGERPAGGRHTHLAQLSDSAQLPTRWYGYDGVDLVVLSTSTPEVYRQLSSPQLDALDRWLRLGGRLLLLAGRSGSELLKAEGPLARFAPGEFDSVIPLRQTGALETFAETNDRLDQQPGFSDRAFRLEVPRLRNVRGRIDVYEGNNPADLPLVIRAPHGFGEVVFVGLDLDQPPFDTWKGRQLLVDKLLARPKVAATDSGHESLGQVTSLGYTDLTGQLHGALDQFAEVHLLPFAAVAALVLVYLLCVGPGDYYFLKKIVGRMEYTWLTFPLLVLAFSAGAYALAYRLRGTELHLNQVDLVDMEVESGLVRGTSWSTIYSPKIETFDLALRPQPAGIELEGRPDVLLSWLALPKAAQGGMQAGAGSLFANPYDFSRSLDRLERLPISIWSTRSLQGRWSASAKSPVTAELFDRGDRMLSGSLEIAGPLELDGAVLMYDRWAYPIARWPQSRGLKIESDLEPQTVETLLRHISNFDEKAAREPYNRSSTEFERIMEMVMFYDLAGGQGYTGLAHRAQGFADLSNQVRLGRAVLVGRVKTPGAALERDGQPLGSASGESWTFCRFVLPVRQQRSE